MDKLWGVYFEEFVENWPRYDSTALYNYGHSINYIWKCCLQNGTILLWPQCVEPVIMMLMTTISGIILCMRPANERQRYKCNVSHWLGACTEDSLLTRLFLQVLGFDLEWVSLTPDGGSCMNPVSLMQLATHTGLCVLVRLHLLPEIPAGIKAMLRDRG